MCIQKLRWSFSLLQVEIPRAFVCAESKIFDVSEWAICQVNPIKLSLSLSPPLLLSSSLLCMCAPVPTFSLNALVNILVLVSCFCSLSQGIIGAYPMIRVKPSLSLSLYFYNLNAIKLPHPVVVLLSPILEDLPPTHVLSLALSLSPSLSLSLPHHRHKVKSY